MGTSARTGFRNAVLAATAIAAICAAPAARAQAAAAQPAQAGVADYDIPAQPLASALTAFAQRSGVKLAYTASLSEGRSAPALKGSFTRPQALSRLLAGSGLSYRFSGASAVTIVETNAAAGGVAANVPGALALDTIDVQGAGQSPFGPGEGYVATRSVTGTKSDTPLIETPQSISVVTRQQMDDQNVQTVAQALRYTPGIMAEQRGANTDSLEYLYSRGFQIDEYLNGLRLPGAVAGFNITSFDPYLLDRIELLHGPASVLYGQASPGGVLNLTSKRPTEETIREVMLQTGSYGRAQGAFDLSGKLNDDGTLLGRLTADSFSTGTQTNFINEQRISIAPALTWRPDNNTNLTIFGNYQYDPEAGLYNFVPAQGTVLPGYYIPRYFNSGEPSFDRFSKTEASIGYSFSHKLDDTWSVYQDFRYLYNRQTWQGVLPDSLTPDGTELTREADHNQGTVNAVTLDNRVQAKAGTGPLQHTITFGVDWQRTAFDHVFLGGDAPNLSVVNPQYGQPVAQPTFMYGTSADQVLSQVGFYGQDQIKFGQWAFVAGVRQDFANEHSETLTTSAITDQSDQAFTWRTGLVYLFDNGIAPYASYSTSFQPTVGTTFSGTSFQPTTGQQYEAGVKYQPPGSNSFLTASVFNLTEQNVLTTDPEHASFQVQTGAIRSRGFELEAHVALPANLQLVASYTFLDLRNTQSAANILNKVPVGIPQTQGSIWMTYDLPWEWSQGLQLGGGARYVGPTYGDQLNTFQVPSATLFDAAIHYDLGKTFPELKGVSLAVTASNVFDKSYISYCSSGSSAGCAYGAGRLVLANLKYRW